MKKDPAFLFYSADFLVGVTDLTMEERGQYITIMCLQHQKGHLSKKALEIAVPGVSLDVLSKLEIDEAGNYYSRRLDDVLRLSQIRQKAGSEGGKANCKQNLKQNPSKTVSKIQAKPEANPYQMHYQITGGIIGGYETENENTSKDITTEEELGNGSEEIVNPSKGITTEEENENGSKEVESESKTSLMQNRFDRFWDAYPKKTGKAQAQRTFFRIAPSEELTQKILSAIEKQKSGSMWMKNHGEFIPYPSTWLNRGQWDDEVEETQVRTSQAPAARSYAGNAVSRGGREGTVQYTGEEYFGYAGVGLEVPPEARTWGDDHPEGGKNSG